MIIFFLKLQPNNTQRSHFWSQIQAFSFFSKSFQILKFQGADFKYNNSLLKFLEKHTQVRNFWLKIKTFSFSKVLFPNMRIFFFEIPAKKSHIRNFCSKIEKFSFSLNFLKIGKFDGADFKHDNSFFQILASTCPDKIRK